jgi:hypothetical protein
MTDHTDVFAAFSDIALLDEARRLAGAERAATAALIRCLMEVDARRLYLGQGCSSMFTYCTRVLHLSEHAAYGRIQAARAARRFPALLDRLADGSVTLSTIGLLAPHLTTGNHGELLVAARHKSKREVERLVAELRPRPDVPTIVRKVPAPVSPAPGRPPSSAGLPTKLPNHDLLFSGARACDATRPAAARQLNAITPLAPARYKVQITVSQETHDKLRRLQDLMRHTIPTGEPAAIVDRALTLLLEHVQRQKLGTASKQRRARSNPHGRSIAASVKRAVWTRDGGRCAFVGSAGRCAETGFLEYHHVIPYARGGPATAGNIELRCRAHNQHEAGVGIAGQASLLRAESRA